MLLLDDIVMPTQAKVSLKRVVTHGSMRKLCKSCSLFGPFRFHVCVPEMAAGVESVPRAKPMDYLGRRVAHHVGWVTAITADILPVRHADDGVSRHCDDALCPFFPS